VNVISILIVQKRKKSLNAMNSIASFLNSSLKCSNRFDPSLPATLIF